MIDLIYKNVGSFGIKVIININKKILVYVIEEEQRIFE